MKIRDTLFIFILLVFVSGCVHGLGSGGDAVGAGITQSTAGATFAISGIPPKISNASEFDLEVTATNLGSYSFQPNDVLATLSNTKQFTFSLNDNSFQTPSGQNGLTNDQLLMKALDSDVEGGSVAFYFSNMKYISGTATGQEINIPLSVNTCYYYSTIATLDVCVAEDVISDICSSTEQKRVINQAGPIHISRFEQEDSSVSGSVSSQSRKIDSNVIIFISAYGNEKIEAYETTASQMDGDAVTATALKKDRLLCTNSDSNRYTAVRLKSIQVGNEVLVGGKDIDKYCEVSAAPNIIVLDDNGQASVSCALPLTNSYSSVRGDYTERMTIILDYIISDTVTKSLTVVGT